VDFDDLGADISPKQYAIAYRVAQGPAKDDRTFEETLVGSGLPGDSHGRLGLDPEPFRGMDLSKNPHVEIPPALFRGLPDGQNIPTLERMYQVARKLTHYTSDSEVSPYTQASSKPRHKDRPSTGLRKLGQR
jgi:hypothetical protein